MEIADQRLLAEVAWKENREGGLAGMQSIINNVTNRVACHRYPNTVEGVIMQPWQYTSMSVKTDPQFGIDPDKSKGADRVAWGMAQELARQAASGVLADLTSGATLYYNPDGIKSTAKYQLPNGDMVKWPETWKQAKVRYVGTIAEHLFFVEL
jgi:spore germination cell wall hydrolase CwlJ-like protein